ncbi:hypothetical protein P7C70_g6955, partial [Phenoliferia sp. Uapishka_3]
MTTKQQDIKQSHFLEDFLMGGAAGAIAKTAAAPIERIKVCLRCEVRSAKRERESLKTGRLATPYKGILDAGRRAVAEEGALSLLVVHLSNIELCPTHASHLAQLERKWRERPALCVILNFTRYKTLRLSRLSIDFPTQALNFAFKDGIKSRFSYKKADGFGKWVAGNIASGAAAGAASSVFVYSLDYARTRLSADNKSAKTGGSRQFSGILDVYKQTLAADGIKGLYRGFGPSLVGICVYRGFYFGLYDTAKDTLLVGSLQNSFIASFGVGWVVTTGAGLASYPLDTVRRWENFLDSSLLAAALVITGDLIARRTERAFGMIDCFNQIVRKEGFSSLFKGAAANILRGVAGAGVLSLYDVFQRLMFGKIYSAGSA